MARGLATPQTALVLAFLTAAVTAVAVVLAVLDHSVTAGGGSALFLVPGFGLVGAVVARRQPQNAIGWSMLGAALFIAVSALASTYSVLDYRHHHGHLPLGPVAVLLQPGWAPAIILIAMSIVLFPDGKLPSGWWRSGSPVRMLGAGAALVGGMLSVTQSGSGVFYLLGFVGTLGLLGLPLGIGIGILRYRLYDIDRLISRTLSYALVTGLLVGLSAGLVLLTTRVLPFSSPVGVAASTLAAAGLFSPLRSRLQRLVDRRFNRARYDAETTVAALAASLRDAVDVNTILDELAAAATRSLEPTHMTVWTRT
jgi:hypothetical protein